MIPAGFGGFIRGEGSDIAVTERGANQASPQLGEYDPEILCGACDGQLGRLDAYGLDVCRTFQAAHRRLGGGRFDIPAVDGDQFAKFVLAVLWRASISRRGSFESVALGRYQETARQVLFGVRDLGAGSVALLEPLEPIA